MARQSNPHAEVEDPLVASIRSIAGESRFAPETVPWRTIPAALEDAFARFGHAEAVVGTDRRLTFDEVCSTARAFAGHLAARHQPGFRAAIWAPNDWQWVVAACGIWYAGGVVIPIGTRLHADEAAEVLSRSRAEVLVAYGSFRGGSASVLLRALLGPRTDEHPVRGLPALVEVITVDGRTDAGDTAFSDALEATPLPAAVARGEHDVAEIVFTSGTTGEAKGVVLTHAQILPSYWCSIGLNGVREGDRYLTVMPFGHAGGLNACLLGSMLHGFTNVTMATFDTQAAVELVARERISVLMGPPALMTSILDEPDFAVREHSTLRLALVGASFVAPELIERLRASGLDRVVNVYGLSEASNVALTRAEDGIETVSTTVGLPLPGVEVRVIDERGSDVPAGTPGELLVRGHNVMAGYLAEDGATIEATDGDRWLRTGDIVAVTDSGHLRLIDRKKDVVITGGFTVYSGEVESRLRLHEDVGQVAVIGVPDDRLGEVGFAFVVPAGGHAVDADAVLAWARTHMADFKAPRHAAIVAALPLNSVGKVDKPSLRRDAASLRVEPIIARRDVSRRPPRASE